MSSLRDNMRTFETFWNGFRHFEETGGHLPDAYPAMRKLFVESNGRFNDVFHFLYNFNKPYRPMPQGVAPFLNLRGVMPPIDWTLNLLN